MCAKKPIYTIETIDKLAWSIAYKYKMTDWQRRLLDHDDLHQIALQAMYPLMERSYSTTLMTVAAQNRIGQALIRLNSVGNKPYGLHMISSDTEEMLPHEDTKQKTPLEILCTECDIEQMLKALNKLTKKEKQVIELLYLTPKTKLRPEGGHSMTMLEASEILNCTKGNIDILEKKALQHLRDILEGRHSAETKHSISSERKKQYMQKYRDEHKEYFKDYRKEYRKKKNEQKKEIKVREEKE
jgi:RNA polymerase sigma factor (sigma-70 family)